jgi:hypothetical protein
MIYLFKMIFLLQMYLNANKNNFTPHYNKGLIQINKLLKVTYSKLEHYYYQYILYPELQYHID